MAAVQAANVSGPVMGKINGQQSSSNDETKSDLNFDKHPETGIQEVRKSSRPRKKTTKAQSLSPTDEISLMEDETPLPKTGSKKRRQQRIVCSLCGKLLRKQDIVKKQIIGDVTDNDSLKMVDNVMKNLCSKCAQSIERKKKAEKPTKADREKFEAEGISFGEELSRILGDSEAERLYCPFYQVRPCGCVQKYISGEIWKKKKYIHKTPSGVPTDFEAPGKDASEKERGLFLLSLRQKSLQERKEIINARRQRKRAEREFPEEFTQFLLSHRLVLRKAGLCERGCQRVLGYSNNFLHKKIMNGPRLPPSKGKAVGVPIKIEDLPRKTCCRQMCVKMAESNSDLLETWRHQAAQNQKLSRQVIMEMFAPNSKKHVNCPDFVTMVTGSCKSTVMKIRTEMLLSENGQQLLEKGAKKRPSETKPDDTPQAKQANMSSKTELLMTSGSFGPPVTLGNSHIVKTSSFITPVTIPMTTSAPLIRVPVKALTSKEPVLQKQVSPIKLLEDRHKKELEELRRKQQEELVQLQKKHLQQQQQQKIVLGPVEQNPNNTVTPIPVKAARSLSLPTQSSKAQVSTMTMAPTDGGSKEMPFISIASGQSLDETGIVSGAKVSSVQCLTIPGLLDSNVNPVTSNAISFILAQAQGMNSQHSQQVLVIPSSSSTSSLSSCSNIPTMPGHSPQIAHGMSTACLTIPSQSTNVNVQSARKQANPNTSHLMEILQSQEALKHLLVSNKPVAFPKTVESTQTSTPNTVINISKSDTQSVQKSQLQSSTHTQLDLSVPTINSQTSQHLQTAHIGAKQPADQIGFSQTLKSEQNDEPGTRYAMPPTSKGLTLSLSNDIGLAMPGIQGECLPASDLQSIEVDTVTYSNVPLSKDTVVSSSIQRGQINSQVVTLNAQSQGMSLIPVTVDLGATNNVSTSVASSAPLMALDDKNNQFFPASQSFYVSFDGKNYCVVQTESQYPVNDPSVHSSESATVSAMTKSLPSSSLPSDFPSVPFTPYSHTDQKLSTVNTPLSVAINQFTFSTQSDLSQLTHNDVVTDSGISLKNNIISHEQLLDNPKSSSLPSLIQNGNEGSQHPNVMLSHQRMRTNRDRSQPVIGIVHPHITTTRSNQAEGATNLETLPSNSSGSSLNYTSAIQAQQSIEVTRHAFPAPQVSHQHNNTHFQQLISPMHQPESNLSQGSVIRPQEIILPQGLTLTEEQLRDILGSSSQVLQQPLIQQHNNASVQNSSGEQQHQQYQPSLGQSRLSQSVSTAVHPFHSTLSETSQQSPLMTGVEGTGCQPVENSALSSLARVQSTEYTLPSASAQLNSTYPHDPQPIIPLSSSASRSNAVTEVVYTNSQLTNELQTTSGSRDNKQQATSNIEQTTFIDIPLVMSQLSTVNTHSTVTVSSQGQSSLMTLLASQLAQENIAPGNSEQTQRANLISLINALPKVSPVELTSESPAGISVGKTNSHGSALVTGPGILKPGNKKENSTPSSSRPPNAVGQPLVSSHDAMISLNHRTNNNLPITVNLEQNSSTALNNTTVPTPGNQLSLGCISNPSVAESDVAMTDVNERASTAEVYLRMPPHEVPVIQHTLDQRKIVMLSQDGNSASIALPSSQGDQHIVLNLASQDSASTSTVISSLNASSIIVPMLDKKNESQVSFAGGATQQEGSFHQDIHNFVIAGSQSTHQSQPSIPQELLNVFSQSVPTTQTSSHDSQNSLAISLSGPVSWTSSQNSVTQTDNQIHNITQASPSFGMAQSNQMSMAAKQSSSLTKTPGQSKNYVSHLDSCLAPQSLLPSTIATNPTAVTKPLLSSQSTKPRGNTVILVPDKPGFPRYQVTQLSPEPEEKQFFSNPPLATPVTSTLVVSDPQNQDNVSTPQHDTILQLITQSLMSQNLKLTNGMQIVLPFSEGQPNASSITVAKPDFKPEDESRNIERTPFNSRLCKSEQVKTQTPQEKVCDEINSAISYNLSDKSIRQLQPSCSDIQSLQSPLKEVAANNAILQRGSESVGNVVIDKMPGKVGQDYGMDGHSSTHIIGNMKIGSLVKTSDGNKISNTSIGNVRMITESLQSNNASIINANLPETEEQLSTQNLIHNPSCLVNTNKSSLAAQPSVVTARETCLTQTAEGVAEIIKPNDVIAIPIKEDNLNTDPQVSANLGGTQLLPVRILDNGACLISYKDLALAQGMLQGTFSSPLHDSDNTPQLQQRELVIDITGDSSQQLPSELSDRHVPVGGSSNHTGLHHLSNTGIQSTLSEVKLNEPVQIKETTISPAYSFEDLQQDQRVESLTMSKKLPQPSPGGGTNLDITGDPPLRTMLENPEAHTATLMKILKNANEYMNTNHERETSVNQISYPARTCFQNTQNTFHHNGQSVSSAAHLSNIPGKFDVVGERKTSSHFDNSQQSFAPVQSVTIVYDHSQEVPENQSSLTGGNSSEKVVHSDKRKNLADRLIHNERVRPGSLSQLHIMERSKKTGERQARRRTQSTGTPSNISLPKMPQTHSYPAASSSSSTVDFTHETSFMDDSAGPPNVTLVSPKRKEFQGLENTSVLSQNQTVDLLNATLSQSSNESQRGAQDVSITKSFPSTNMGSFPSKFASNRDKSLVDYLKDPKVQPARKTQKTGKDNADDTSRGKFFSVPSPGFSPTQQTKTTDKSSDSKSRKHTKPATIRDLLDQKVSSQILSSTVPPVNQAMHYIIPASGDSTLVAPSSNSPQILTVIPESGHEKMSSANDTVSMAANADDRSSLISPKMGPMPVALSIIQNSPKTKSSQVGDESLMNTMPTVDSRTQPRFQLISAAMDNHMVRHGSEPLPDASQIIVTSSMSMSSASSNMITTNSNILGPLTSMNQNHLIRCPNPQLYASSKFSHEEQPARRTVTSTSMTNVREGTESVLSECVHSKEIGEKGKSSGKSDNESSHLESAQLHSDSFHVRDNTVTQTQPFKHTHKLVTNVLNEPSSSSLLNKELFSKENMSMSESATQEQILYCGGGRHAPSDRNQPLLFDSTDPACTSHQSVVVTASHILSRDSGSNSPCGDTLIQIAQGLRSFTPEISQILQSSLFLRSWSHPKGENGSSVVWTDPTKETMSTPQSFDRITEEKNESKLNELVDQPSVTLSSPDYASMHERKTNPAHAETVSSDHSEIPRVSMADRITQVINNMYHVGEENMVYSEGSKVRPKTSPLEDTGISSEKKQVRGSSCGEQRASVSEDDVRSALPRKRKSRKRTISSNSSQGSSEDISCSRNAHINQHSGDISSSDLKGGKRTRSRKDRSSKERVKSTKSGGSGHSQPKRVQFSDVINKDPSRGKTDTSSIHKLNATTPASLSSVSATVMKDDTCSPSNSNYQPTNVHNNSSTKSLSFINERQSPGLTPQFPLSSHGEIIYHNLSPEEHDSHIVANKKHHGHSDSQQLDMSQSHRMESIHWTPPSGSLDNYSRAVREPEEICDSVNHNVVRHFHIPAALHRSFKPRKEAEVIVSHSQHSDKKTKPHRLGGDSSMVSPNFSHSPNQPSPDYSEGEIKELSDRGHPMTWNYPDEPISSFEIISAQGYSKLSQQLKSNTSLAPLNSKEFNSGLLPSSSESLSSSSKDSRDYLSSLWQANDDSDSDLCRLDKTLDPSVKRQKALQSDYKLAQQMAQRQSQIRTQFQSSLESNHSSLDSSLPGLSHPSFQEQCFQNRLQEISEVLAPPVLTESKRALFSTFRENIRLKKAVYKATESRQKNLSVVEQQKNRESPFEADHIKIRNSSKPSSPFEIDSRRSSPRTMSFSKHGPSSSQTFSRSHHPSSQESRSRNASGSHGLNQYYGDFEPHLMLDPFPRLFGEFDASQGETFYPLGYNSFIPLTNVGLGLDSDPLPGQVDMLSVRGLSDCDPDGHNRHRNLSSSSQKSLLMEGGTDTEHGSRSRNLSSSSLLRFLEQNNIRSRNPSGSSNRRSRPGSCSSDREQIDFDLFSLLANSPHLGE